MTRLRIAAHAVAAVVIVVGVHAGTGASLAGAATPQPARTSKTCSLLKTREVSKVLGIRVQAGRPQKLPTQHGMKRDRCDWESTKKGAGGIRGKSLEFNLVTLTGSGADRYFEGLVLIELGRRVEHHAVPDLGRNAVYEVPSNGLLVLISDTRLVIVGIDQRSFDKSKANVDPEGVTVAAAKLVVPRLQP
jgi:hypothetical protein